MNRCGCTGKFDGGISVTYDFLGGWIYVCYWQETELTSQLQVFTATATISATTSATISTRTSTTTSTLTYVLSPTWHVRHVLPQFYCTSFAFLSHYLFVTTATTIDDSFCLIPYLPLLPMLSSFFSPDCVSFPSTLVEIGCFNEQILRADSPLTSCG